MANRIYFEKMIIENFQSHEYTEIHFKKGLNVITGKSDSGKSAILRALRWLIYNEPRGIEYIRNGKKQTRVSLTFQSQITITKERSKTINRYIISKSDGEQQIFEGFGNEVPLEVQQIHNMIKMVIDDDLSQNINFAPQLEEAFLISQPPSARAKALGKLGGIQIVDKAIRDGVADQKKNYQKIGRLEEDIKENTSRLEQFKNLHETTHQLEMIHNNIETIEVYIQKINQLKEYNNEYIRIENEKNETSKNIKALENIDNSVKVIGTCEKNIGLYNILNNKNAKLLSLKTEIDHCQQIIFRYKDISRVLEKLDTMDTYNNKLNTFNKLFNKYNELCVSIEKGVEFIKAYKNIPTLSGINEKLPPLEKRLELMKKMNSEYCKNILEITNTKNELKTYEQLVNRVETELNTVLDEAGKCPLCGSVIDEKVKQNILN